MGLAAGTKLGPYEILSPLGAGGMGEVYRAHDAKLKRDVALKVLPAAFVSDLDRHARFQREARVLASLDHPNIASIYGLEESSGVTALVMGLVEGPTLADQLAAGPIAPEEAVGVARQIAEALEYAHDKGVVHRDLKPANVKITPDGVVKVLDFGLAKALDDERAAASGENSPTLTLGTTQAGVILGTAAYMSPEQAKGKRADRRSDIWAFGVVLYEMFTGKRLFTGDGVGEILAAVIKEEPKLDAVPAAWRGLVARCLHKDPRRRLQAIGEARLLLEGGTETPVAAVPAPRGSFQWKVAAATLAAVALVLAGSLWRATRPVDRPLLRLSVDLGPDAVAGDMSTAAISRDGSRLVFLTISADGKQRLATRLLDQSQATVLAETDSATDPFFSPDGQWVAFFASGRLKKISLQGGGPIVLCDAPTPRGGSWGEDGFIVAALNNVTGLSRVSDNGGPPQPLTQLKAGEVTHRWPQVLPGSQAVLFTVSTNLDVYEDSSIELLTVKTGKRETVHRGGYFGRFLPTHGTAGHLMYVRQGVLFGMPFDPAHPELQTSPTPVLHDLASSASTAGGQADFSHTGTFVYLSGKPTPGWQVVWLDSSGKTQPLIAAPGLYYTPRVSPDGQRLVLAENSGTGEDLFIYDWQRVTKTRLTFTGREATYPVWAPDGKHIAFRDRSGATGVIQWIRADGAGQPHRLLESQGTIEPYSFSPDGRRLTYEEILPNRGYDIWTLPLDLTDPDHPKPGKPEAFLRTPAAERDAAFSPDGRWIAYRSNESGIPEVYVRPFPNPEGSGKWQVSTGGGVFPMWSRNSRELFYREPGRHIMVAEYAAKGDSLSVGTPRLWSDKQVIGLTDIDLELAPDGKRFAAFVGSAETETQKDSVHVTFLLNFFDELRRRIPAGK